MEQVDIYKFRLKESKFIKKEQKYLLNYQGESIGIFTEHYIPPDLEQLKARHINWKKVDIFVHNDQPIEKLTLLDDDPQLMFMRKNRPSKKRIHKPRKFESPKTGNEKQPNKPTNMGIWGDICER